MIVTSLNQNIGIYYDPESVNFFKKHEITENIQKTSTFLFLSPTEQRNKDYFVCKEYP